MNQPIKYVVECGGERTSFEIATFPNKDIDLAFRVAKGFAIDKSNRYKEKACVFAVYAHKELLYETTATV